MNYIFQLGGGGAENQCKKWSEKYDTKIIELNPIRFGSLQLIRAYKSVTNGRDEQHLFWMYRAGFFGVIVNGLLRLFGVKREIIIFIRHGLEGHVPIKRWIFIKLISFLAELTSTKIWYNSVSSKKAHNAMGFFLNCESSVHWNLVPRKLKRLPNKDLWGRKFKFSKIRFICLARHAPEKNLETLIQAFESAKCHDFTSLHVVGSGVSALNKLSFKTNLHEHCKMPAVAIALSDVVIIPSITESLSNVLQEAMSQSKWIITTDVGDHLIYLDKHNYDKFLVTEKSETKIKEAIDGLAYKLSQD